MTRSPITATLLPLVPLAALGWPLASVLNKEPYQQSEVPEEVATGPLITADLFIKSAHPFEKVEVSAGEATWTFEADDDVKEIYFPNEDSVFLKVSVTWPEDTPESAVLLTLQAEGREDRFHTLWGELEQTEEIQFSWRP